MQLLNNRKYTKTKQNRDNNITNTNTKTNQKTTHCRKDYNNKNKKINPKNKVKAQKLKKYKSQ